MADQGAEVIVDDSAGVVRRLDTDDPGEDHFAWSCGLCNTEGTAYYEGGAWANLVNHVSGWHMQGVGRG